MKRLVRKCFVLLLFALMATSQHAVSNPITVDGHNDKLIQSDTQKVKKAGYEVDGRTSASVIAAKRSHTVSSKDEMGLAIFSGIFVIGVIVFLIQLMSKK